MKKKPPSKAFHIVMEIPGLQLDPKGKKELEVSMEVLNRQAELLGLVDPLGPEPAFIFFPEERKQ
jgi:hypothetical protein